MDLYIHIPIRLHGVVLNLLSTGTIPFTYLLPMNQLTLTPHTHWIKAPFSPNLFIGDVNYVLSTVYSRPETDDRV
jgi:hypothetical protein